MGRMSFFNQTVLKNLALIFLLIFGLAAAPAVYGTEVREVGVIQVEELNMRTGPGLDQPVIKVLEKQVHVRVLAYSRGWLKISYDGDVGYIANRRKYVKLYTIHTMEAGKGLDLDSAREKARKIRQKIKDRQAEIERYTREEKQIIGALDRTEQELANVRQKVRHLQREISDVEEAIKEKDGQIDRLKKEVAEEKIYAMNRLAALYKMKRIGAMNLLASAESMHDLLIRKAAMKKILNYDQLLVAELLEKRGRLAKTVETLAAQKRQKSILEAEYANHLKRLKQKKAERERILSDIRNRKANRMTTLKYLKNAAARLDRKVSELKRRPTIQKPSSESFTASRGLLNKPVKGKIISDYGKYIESRSGVVNFRNGIEIKSPRGTPFRAVFAGRTIYADWLKGYGNIAIIAHGNDYHTVYAHAEELFLSKGDQVDAGDVIGTVGDTGTMSGTALYFEIRHNGDPVNPSEWIDNS